jgi:sRNA-binding protein
MVEAKQIITAFARRYPNCFSAEAWEPHRPLVIGIRKALVADGIELQERNSAARWASTVTGSCTFRR